MIAHDFATALHFCLYSTIVSTATDNFCGAELAACQQFVEPVVRMTENFKGHSQRRLVVYVSRPGHQLLIDPYG
jgi:hypothetical protein